MKKRTLSLLMCLMMLIGMLPTTAFAAGGATGTWDVDLVVSTNSTIQYDGRDTIALDFRVQSDDLTIRKANYIVLAFDLEILDFLQYTSSIEKYEPTSTTGLVTNANALAKGLEISKNPITGATQNWAIQVNCSKSPDGKIGYMQMLASQDYTDFAVTAPKDIVTTYLGLKSGKSVNDLQKNSIRFATPAELDKLN